MAEFWGENDGKLCSNPFRRVFVDQDSQMISDASMCLELDQMHGSKGSRRKFQSHSMPVVAQCASRTSWSNQDGGYQLMSNVVTPKKIEK